MPRCQIHSDSDIEEFVNFDGLNYTKYFSTTDYIRDYFMIRIIVNIIAALCYDSCVPMDLANNIYNYIIAKSCVIYCVLWHYTRFYWNWPLFSSGMIFNLRWQNSRCWVANASFSHFLLSQCLPRSMHQGSPQHACIKGTLLIGFLCGLAKEDFSTISGYWYPELWAYNHYTIEISSEILFTKMRCSELR